MRFRRRLNIVFCVLAAWTGSAPLAAQQAAPEALRLADLEAMALRTHPALRQAAARVDAAGGRKLQAGLYPNPIIGATGDENSGGPIIRGGEFGGFVEQTIVTAGKLRHARAAAGEQVTQAALEREAARLRILGSVRVLYYEALGSGKRVAIREELVNVTEDAVETTRQLVNVGQADQPDLLEVQMEHSRTRADLLAARSVQRRAFRQLGAVIGNPLLGPSPLEGELSPLPSLDFDEALKHSLAESPEIRFAEAGVALAESALRKERAERVPDISVRGGLRYNRELLDFNGAPVGMEGFFDVGVELPIFNRNQGNISAAEAELESAKSEVERRRMMLRMRMAGTFQHYRESLDLARAYSEELMPAAGKAFEQYQAAFRRMAASYPQVLIARRNLFQLREKHLDVRINAWRSAVEIRNMLLVGEL